MLDKRNYAGVPGYDFSYADRLIARTGAVTGQESPAQLLALNAEEKQDALRKARADFEAKFDWGRFEQAENWQDKERKQKQNLFNMGAIFA